MPQTPLIQQLDHISHYAVIVAGGTGSRMGSSLPKQFLLLNDKPILMHTIEVFAASVFDPCIIVVLHADHHDRWRHLCQQHSFKINHTLIAGGETRFHSVKKAIDLITDKNVLIAVHDAVRPLVTIDIIDNAYTTAQIQGTAITAVKSRDSVRQLTGERSVSLDRERIYLIQTPQTFRGDIITRAYAQPYDPLFTDDASVVERSGVPVALIDGIYSNIKITFPEDITIAEALLNKKPQL